MSVCLSVIRISLEPLVRWISNLTGVLLRARVSAVPSLTLFGLEVQKILLNISVKEALRRLWFKNKHTDIRGLWFKNKHSDIRGLWFKNKRSDINTLSAKH